MKIRKKNRPKVIKNKKIEQFRATNKQKKFNLHFDSHFVSCSYEGKFRSQFGFVHLNLFVSNFYLWCNKLTQINHVIGNIFQHYTYSNSKYI